MIEQEIKSKSKHIDSFLRKEPRILKKLDEMIEQTQEFTIKQYLYYSLLKLTSDVKTFKTELVSHLANDKKLALAIVKRASIGSRTNASFSSPRISRLDVQKSIQRIGYGAVHNELQLNYAKQYVEIYKERKELELRDLLKKSVRMGFLAVEFAKLVNYRDTSSVFFAAMNYNIAEMVLFLRDEKRYHEYHKLLKKGLSEKTAELASFGFDLGELATKMLKKWELPDHIVELVSQKENPEEISVNNTKLDTLLRFTNYAVKAMDKEDASPASISNVAQDYLSKLDLEIDSDQWQEEIKSIFIKVLETEYTLFNSKK
jgi:HD-like signal output (HDOD) protein